MANKLCAFFFSTDAKCSFDLCLAVHMNENWLIFHICFQDYELNRLRSKPSIARCLHIVQVVIKHTQEVFQ